MNHSPKKISFLATGSELVQGDIEDKNGTYFAKKITDHGGILFQRLQSLDHKNEIIAALHYLFSHSDAVILTGGLGPTSDDLTRYAIAEFTGHELVFDESAWQHVKTRLQQYGLAITESNRQQALFPKGAHVFPNPHGTAYGCYLPWKNKHICMLPGPPRECVPMFDEKVMLLLQENNFFTSRKIYRWLTLGLIEGEIASEIDALVKPYAVETGYRWNYPYLEIKIIDDVGDDHTLRTAIDKRLLPYTVSHGDRNAFELLKKALKNFNKTIHVIDHATMNLMSPELKLPALVFTDSRENHDMVFHITASPWLEQSDTVLTLQCQGYVNKQLCFEHHLSIPNRDREVIHYINAYFAWQLARFIESL